MGVYIPNMEKPKNCRTCNFKSNKEGECWFVHDENDCPLIEIDEPKVGRWIDTNMTCCGAKVYKCSVCDNEIDEMSTEMGEPIWNYCPNCGAKMERRADEDI